MQNKWLALSLIPVSTVALAITSTTATKSAQQRAMVPAQKVVIKKAQPVKQPLFTAAAPNLHPRFGVHGFLSAGLSASNSAINYNIPGHGAINNRLNYAVNSLVGVQLSARLGKRLSAVMQLVADGDNTNGHTAFSPQVQWAFLRYRVNRDLQVRAGRFQTPFFLYSSTVEVGYTYPWVLLPNEVYRIVPFSSLNGFDAVYTHAIGHSGWVFKVHPFVGANSSKFSFYQPGKAVPVVEKFNENDMLGMAASVSDSRYTLRATYAQTNLSTAPGSTLIVINNKLTSFYGIAAKARWQKFMLTTEYAHRNTPNNLASLSGFYAMLGYTWHKWLPNFTYASLVTTNKSKMVAPYSSILPQDQVSYTAGVDYTFNPNLILKTSASLIKPTNGTNGLFSQKLSQKTVMLYGVSLDAIF